MSGLQEKGSNRFPDTDHQRQKTDLMMCRQCAGEGYKIDLNTLISGLLGIGWENEGIGPAVEIACDRCGMTADEFNRTGKIGCSRCYDVFREPMKVLLKRIQGNTRHQGRFLRDSPLPMLPKWKWRGFSRNSGNA